MPKAPRASVNPVLVPGVNRFGSTKSARLARRSQRKYPAKPAAAPAAKKTVGFYPVDTTPSPIPSAARNRSQRITKLRDSIKPGQVLILLAGRFKGHRVVFLKQLPSGLLLVTGPFKVNGVPLRRVNQRMVIATSTRLDVSKVAADKIDDALFARSENESAKKYAGKPFLATEEEAAHALPAEFKTTQAAVDAALAPQLKAEPLLKAYLGSRFSLTKDLVPHLIKF